MPLNKNVSGGPANQMPVIVTAIAAALRQYRSMIERATAPTPRPSHTAQKNRAVNRSAGDPALCHLQITISKYTPAGTSTANVSTTMIAGAGNVIKRWTGFSMPL